MKEALKKGQVIEIQAAGELLQLWADHALYWPAQKILCFSDVHLGKAETLQGMGIPVPSGGHLTDLGRIAKLLRDTGAKRVLILGDLIHKKKGMTDEIIDHLGKFLKFASEVEFELLLGNHEKGASSLWSGLKIKVHQGDLIEGPFRFSHGHDENGGFEKEIPEDDSLYTIQGHLHPQVVLRQGSTRLRLSCFWVKPKLLTLPAFGSFTGGWEVKSLKRDRVFATTGEKLIDVSNL